MASYNAISPEKLARLIGTPKAPVIVDVRDDDDFDATPSLIPSAIRKDHADVDDWAPKYRGRWVVVACQKGLKLSEGVAALLRSAGIQAEILEGGVVAWQEAALPLVPVASLSQRKATGGTLWVTRSRPKIDRIACPWLIRRFVDPEARFLYVSPPEVTAVAERFGATPFDIEGVHWSHRGELCTFDVMVQAFDLALPPLEHVARIVRGAEAVAARAAQLYQRAGGGLDERSEIVLRVPNARTVAGRLAVAAFHAVEAGRRALGEPPCELPDELLAHVEALGGEP